MKFSKFALPAVFLLIAAAAVAGWLHLNQAKPAGWQGYVDADYVRIGPTLQGLLTAVPVARGDTVKAGDLLFAQDDGDDLASRDESAARLREAQARLENLQARGREEEIAQATADVADARAARDRAKRDLERDEAMLRTAAVSVQQRDQARADALSTEAKLQSAEAHLALLQASTGRAREIAAQAAVVGEQRAQLAQAEWRLAQRRMAAPAGGLINDVFAHPGETLNPGTPVVSLLPPENIIVRFYAAEPDLPSLHAGLRVRVTCDSCPAGLTAPVTFVSPTAAFTPPVIYSEESRAKLVYLIEARPGAVAVPVLKPGQPVTVLRDGP